MPKNYYLPPEDAARGPWLNNLATKLPTYAATLGLTAEEITSVGADNVFWAYVYDARNQFNQFAKDWTAYKNAARGGVTLGDVPTAPTLPDAPTLVQPDIFGRIAALVARIKAHPGYTEAIGHDLGIIGDEQTIDPAGMKPVLKLTLQAGRPNVGWRKQGMGSLEIHVDRGSGTFAYLATDTVPDYLDTAPLPAPGSSAVWKYKAIYRLNDDQVGQWSDVASISVMG
jgi:hypothetical protein